MKQVFNRRKSKKFRQKLRRESTRVEMDLWDQLKSRKLNGLKFRRQQGIGSYIVDFYCPKIRLAIELDGNSHFESKKDEEYDRKRQESIEKYGIQFIRFTNDEIYESLGEVVKEIVHTNQYPKRQRERWPLLA